MSALSREKFVQQVIEVVRDRFPAAKVSRAEQQPFSLRVNGQLASLENVYRSAVLAPEHANALIEQWMLEMVRASEGTPEQNASYDQLAERIMPVVVREDAMDVQTALMVTQPLVAGLVVAYVVDSERSFWYVPRSAFESWKISIDDLHQRALDNLVGRSEAVSAHAVQDESSGRINLILFQTGDGFDASRILLPTLNERLREHLGSPFLAGVPNREILLCFRDEPETLARVRDQVKSDFRQMPHPITDKLLLVTPDGLALGD
jgi:uncharacterized protein YtpQ (UPF0354 family)